MNFSREAGMERTTCCVVGGGPAGMMLGLLLARAGVQVTVLEKHGDFLRDFRGDTVHPSTLRLLDELGLGERFRALDQSRLDEVAFPVAGSDTKLVVADFRRLPGRYRHIAMVPQWDLLTLLADAAAAEPSFTLRMNTEVTGVVRDASGRVDGVEYRTADGATGTLRSELTVACDGRWSVLRAAAQLPVIEFPMPMDAWWFRLPRRTGEQASALSPQMRTGRFGVVIPREGFLQIAYLARKGIDGQLRAHGVEAFRRDIAELIPWAADRVDSITSMDDVKHLDVRLNRLRQWHRDGLLCIGDAAHAMSPIGGVGINLAVQDAVATATLLAGPLRATEQEGRHVRPAQLAAVRRRRLLPTILVQRLQRILHGAVVDPVLSGTRAGAPRAVVELMRRFPQASAIPAFLIGIGFRPEHAPAFARRAAAPVERP
jgi:2-polyprenyl-6-methoxyphenol hydroxylase-like FAD-dependent oxidoreductase